MNLYKLTEQQKDLLVGQLFRTDSYFNPIQDINGGWFISEMEHDECNIEWVKELIKEEFIAKQFPGPTHI